MNRIFAVAFSCVLMVKSQLAFAQDITRIHDYVSRAESGYVADSEMDETLVRSARLYKIMQKDSQGASLEESDGRNVKTSKSYLPIINGSLNKFYQNGEEITNSSRSTIASETQDQQKPLNHYISFNVGRPMSLTMKIMQDSSTQTLAGQNEIYQGIAGFYIGSVLETLPYVRLEYGAQYEVLSFTEETATQYNGIRNHNGTATLRSFIDIPIFPNLAFSIGAEGGVGLFQHFYNQEISRSFGLSYGFLGGMTFILSRDTSFYILGRRGVIPKQSISYSNGTTKSTSLSSLGIIAGVQFFI